MPDKLSASEALYGFFGWLTTRQETVTESVKHDANVWVDLIKAFCDENKLDKPRGGNQHQPKVC